MPAWECWFAVFGEYRSHGWGYQTPSNRGGGPSVSNRYTYFDGIVFHLYLGQNVAFPLRETSTQSPAGWYGLTPGPPNSRLSSPLTANALSLAKLAHETESRSPGMIHVCRIYLEMLRSGGRLLPVC